MKRIILITELLLPLFVWSQTNTWTGATDTDWHKTCNWSLGVIPTCLQDVVIADVTNDPDITGTAHCKTIQVLGSAIVDIVSSPTGNLQISDANGCSGTATDNGGCVVPITMNATTITYIDGPNPPVTFLWVRGRSNYSAGCSGVNFRYSIHNWEDGTTPTLVWIEAQGAGPYSSSIFTDVSIDGYTFTSASASFDGSRIWSWSAPTTTMVEPATWYMTCP